MTGFIPKDILKKLVVVGNTVSKGNNLEAFFNFLAAASRRVPVCKWNRIQVSFQQCIARYTDRYLVVALHLFMHSSWFVGKMLSRLIAARCSDFATQGDACKGPGLPFPEP